MDSDVDMMEIDQDDHLDHSKGIKRLPTGQTVSSNKRAHDQNDCALGPRKRIRAKRLAKKSNPGGFIVVLDTNILIDHLTDLKTFLSNTHLVESCTIIIPLIVIQEMDSLKRTNQSLVQNFKFINEQLRAEKTIVSDKVWLNKQTPEIVKSASDKVNLTEINNDDRILKTSLLIKEISKESEGSVTLVTDDLNLRNKAIATALTSSNWDEFCDKFGIKNTLATNKKSFERIRPSAKRLQTGTNIRNDKATTLSMKNPDEARPLDKVELSDWCTLKYGAESRLKTFFEKSLGSIYPGEDDFWKMFFNDKSDFQNCSLLGLLRTMKNGWVGTFGDIFNRNIQVRQTIEKLFELLKKEKSIDELSRLLHKLLQSVDEIEDKLKENPQKQR